MKENRGRKYIFYTLKRLTNFARRNFYLFVIICGFGIIIYQCITNSDVFGINPISDKKIFCDKDAELHRDIIENYYERRKVSVQLLINLISLMNADQ